MQSLVMKAIVLASASVLVGQASIILAQPESRKKLRAFTSDQFEKLSKWSDPETDKVETKKS